MSDFNDFGFTTVSEEEIEPVSSKEKISELTADTKEYKKRLDTLYKAIQPLLDNLSLNPEKEYIHWPDRAIRVNEFKDQVGKIYEGDN